MERVTERVKACKSVGTNCQF